MIDGICISKYLKDEKVSYSSLEHISSGIYGNRYKLKTSSNAKYTGNTPVITIPTRNKLTFKGSLPYLFNDNNLVPFSLLEVKEAFKDLSIRLGIDLSRAVVNNFEFGVAIEIPFPFQEFIYHHVGLSNMDSSSYQSKGKYFQDKTRRIKIYDAGRNAKYKLSLPVKQLLQKNKHYNKQGNYVKFEIQYKNPAKYFGRIITVSDITDDAFLSICVQDLFNTYSNITKTGFKVPIDAKELTTPTILAIVLKEIEQSTGEDVENLVKQRIKMLTSLKAWQKYDRRKSIRKAFAGINNYHSPYDISNLLQKAANKFLYDVAN